MRAAARIWPSSEGRQNSMRKIIFGRTGLEISELAFGGGVTGGILINADEATRYKALERAVAAGINWIDTAPVYGSGASEETIGRHLESLAPRPYISTKVRLEAEDMEDIPGAIERSLEHSLKRLQSESVTLFQLTITSDPAWASASRCRRSRCSVAAASPTPSTDSRSRGSYRR